MQGECREQAFFGLFVVVGLKKPLFPGVVSAPFTFG
jgi:hypothetical protein